MAHASASTLAEPELICIAVEPDVSTCPGNFLVRAAASSERNLSGVQSPKYGPEGGWAPVVASSQYSTSVHSTATSLSALTFVLLA